MTKLRLLLALGGLLLWLPSLAGADSSGWQGTLDSSGADLQRPTFSAQAEVPGTEGTVGIQTTTVNASVKAHFDDDYFTLRTQELVRDKVQEQATDWNAPLQPITLGDYQGYFVETPVTYSPGGGGISGFRYAGIDASGRGYLTNGEYVFTVSYHVGGDGVYTNAHQDVMLAQGQAAQQEARAIIMGLRPYRASASTPAPNVPAETPPTNTVPAAPPASPTNQNIPWSTLVGTGAGTAILAAAMRALWKGKSAPAPARSASPTKSTPLPEPPAIYVLQLSTDHVKLHHTEPTTLLISVWKVDPARQTYQVAQEATIGLSQPSQPPQVRLVCQPSPGQLKCQISRAGQPSQKKVHLEVAALAGGSRHSAQVTVEMEPYQLEFF